MEIFLTLFIIIMFFPIPLKFYIYYYNNCYFVKLYNFTLFDNAAFKKKKENIKHKEYNPPIKDKDKSKDKASDLFKSITYRDIKVIINKLSKLKFKPVLNLSSKLQYSFDDAARTAISYGVLSNIPSIIYFCINIIFKTKKYDFEIIPHFNDKLLLKLESKSIIFISIANIIYMIFILFINLLYIMLKNRKTTIHKI